MQLLKSFLLLGFASVSLSAAAQKCKYDIDKKDPFTSEHVQSTTFKIVPKSIDNKGNPGVGWFATYERKGEKKSLGFKIIMFGKMDNVMAEGQKVLLRLEDNSIITLTAQGNFLPEHLVAMTVYTHYNIKFSVTDEDMRKISLSPLTDLQLQLTDREITGSFNGRKGSKFMENAACFL